MSYNGWTNHETWLVNLWLGDNSHETVAEICGDDPDIATLADWLKEYVEEMAEPVTKSASLVSDLMGSAMGAVNWNEIARCWIEDYSAENGEDEEE